MLRELRLLLTAVQFFTRLPVPVWVGHSAQQLEQSARYLPLVGVLVGTIAAVVLWLSAQVLPLTVSVGLSMVAGILATGAFHEDGLSDFADGMRVGAYGAIALVLVLLLKFEALASMCGALSPALVAAALIAAHTVSRLMAA